VLLKHLQFLCIKRNHRQELSATERCIGVYSAASGWEYKLNDNKGKHEQGIQKRNLMDKITSNPAT
jgi:hypothetical protein